MKSYRGSSRMMSTGFVGADDEKSIEFSVDPLMYQKLDIAKPKPGDEKPYDLQKIYQFQLEKDIIKLKKVKGSYADRKRKYIDDRRDDPFYQAVSEVPDLAKDGKFHEVVEHPVTIDKWKLTSQPYGIIAHKRYLEYIANLPKGPTVGEVKDRQQRGMDTDLWEKVLTGKFERTLADFLREEELKAAKEFDTEEDPQAKERRKRERFRLEALKQNNFHELRRKMTEKEFDNSMRDWNKGWHEEFEAHESFPAVMQASKIAGQRATDIVQDDTGPKGPRIFQGEKFTFGQYGNEKAYANYLADGNYGKAEKHLKNHYRDLEKQRIKDEVEEKLKETNRRRIAVTGISVQEDVLRAKFAAAQAALQFNVKIEEASHDEFDAKAKLNLYNSSSFESSAHLEGSSEAIVDGNHLLTLKTKAELEVHQVDGSSSSDSSSASGSSSSNSASPRNNKNHQAVSKEGAEGEEEGPNKTNTDVVGIHSSYGNAPSKLSTAMAALAKYLPRSRSIVPLDSWTKYAAVGDNNNKDDSLLAWNSTNQYESWEDWMEHSKYGKPYHRVYKRCKRFHHWLYDPQPVKTKTDLEKEGELQHLVHMSEEINSRAFQDKLLGLTEDYHVKSKEFKEEMKAKYKYFRRLRKKLDHKNATKEEKHRLEVLEIRYGKFMEAFHERKDAEKQAKATIHIMNELIHHREGMVLQKQSTQRELLWKALLEKYVKRKKTTKDKRKKVEHMLPKIPAHINPQETEVDMFHQDSVRRYLELRIVEREVEKKRKGYVNYVLGITSKDEEEYESSRTADELIFAAQSGNYRQVLDLLDYRKDISFPQNSLVDVNDVGGDGVTATFAVLFNVLQHEALDEDANVEDLFLSPWEKYWKQFRWQSKAAKLLQQDQIRFDKVIQVLLSYGGDLSFPKVEFGKDGMTVFHYAVQVNAFEVVEWLLDHGMDVNHLTTLQHRTALMIAAERNHLELTMFLLKRGGMIAIQHIDKLGNNVLHYAARYASPLLTQLLLICGVQPNVRNKKGLTPADEAKTFNRLELSTAISSYRADIKDHVARIECLMSQMLPFDYHTGKFNGFDEDGGGGEPVGQEPPSAGGADEETKQDTAAGPQPQPQPQAQPAAPRISTGKHVPPPQPATLPSSTAQPQSQSPSEAAAVEQPPADGAADNNNDDDRTANVGEEKKDQTPSEKRVNKVWNRIQKGFSFKSSDFTADDASSDPPVAHIHRSKEQPGDEDSDAISPLALPTRYKLDNNIISKPPENASNVANLPTIRKPKRGSIIMSAPRIRKTMLQLNFIKNQTK